jgi:hypothetical protein
MCVPLTAQLLCFALLCFALLCFALLCFQWDRLQPGKGTPSCRIPERRR